MDYQIELQDGTRITMRPLCATDRERIKGLIEGLSDRSRHFRFATPTPSLSEQQLTELCNIDGYRQYVWGAFRDDTLVGMSRYVRFAHDSTAADLAVTVRENHHGLGLGSLLLEALAIQARRSAIDRFGFYVMGENSKAIRLFAKYGGRLQYSSGLGEGELPVESFCLGRLQPSLLQAA